MECRHFWNIDSQGHAQCKLCGARDYYPPEKIKWTKCHIDAVLSCETRVDTESWLNGKVYERVEV